MIKLNNVRAWMRRHWSILRSRPENGRESLENINTALREIKVNGDRVTKVSRQLVDDAADARRIMTENVANHRRT